MQLTISRNASAVIFCQSQFDLVLQYFVVLSFNREFQEAEASPFQSQPGESRRIKTGRVIELN